MSVVRAGLSLPAIAESADEGTSISFAGWTGETDLGRSQPAVGNLCFQDSVSSEDF